MMPLSATSDQSSFLICAHSSADRRAVLIGLASQAYAASARARSSAAPCASASFLPRSSNARPRSAVIESLARLDQRRQRRLGIGRHREIDFRVALEVLVVALRREIERGDADQLRAGLDDRPRRPHRAVAARVLTVPQKSVSSRPRMTSASAIS